MRLDGEPTARLVTLCKVIIDDAFTSPSVVSLSPNILAPGIGNDNRVLAGVVALTVLAWAGAGC